MAFPGLLEIGSTIALLLGCGGIASLLASHLKLQPEGLTGEDPRRELSQAVLLIVGVFISTAVLEMVRFIVYQPLFHLDERPPLTVDYFDVIFTVFFYLPWGLLLFLVMRGTGQNLESIGVSGKDWKRVTSFGLMVSVFYFIIVGLFASPFSSGYAATTISLVYGLLQNLMIGLSEELVWRGHIQTRVVNCYGLLKGLTGTSVLFALLHFPQRFFLCAGAVLEAISSMLLVIAAGIFFGYIMLKSQNIIAPTIVHVIANWTPLFWGITSF